MKLQEFHIPHQIHPDGGPTKSFAVGGGGVTDITAHESGLVVVSREAGPWLWIHGPNWGLCAALAPKPKSIGTKSKGATS